ncbi:MAG: sigma-70 family RNA polymerase sigma factor [Chloroflexi bacterium]|nr:sigma-70 family RNA polymerase sigma factor [Chloroflexota bacterium]
MAALADSTISNELDWIACAQQGDRQAFGELVELHRPGVLNVVYRMCGDPQLAEEAAQEAFVRAWQNVRRYNPRFAFRNWVYRIALNVAVDVLRRRTETIAIEAEPLTADVDGPEASLERKEQIEQVRQAVLGLPPASRAVLILREYEGMAYQEIADALDIPIGTVMSRLNYARSQIRQILRRFLEET